MSYYIDPRTENDPDFCLPAFDETTDMYGREQLFSVATSVYLRTRDGKYIAMQQTKDSRVVDDNIVGIGGKSLLGTLYGNGNERVRMESTIVSIMSGHFNHEDIDEVAIREVFEETGGYNPDGTLSGYGIKLKKSKLQPIGTSTIRLFNEKVNQCWSIKYYIYDLDGTEGEIMPGYSKEGAFSVYTYEELLDRPMLPADRIILQNLNPNIRIEAIYDDIYGVYKLRTILDTKDRLVSVLIPNFEKPYYVGREHMKIDLNTVGLSEKTGLREETARKLLEDPTIKEGLQLQWGIKRVSDFSATVTALSDTLSNIPYIGLTPFQTEKKLYINSKK